MKQRQISLAAAQRAAGPIRNWIYLPKVTGAQLFRPTILRVETAAIAAWAPGARRILRNPAVASAGQTEGLLNQEP